MFDLFGGSASLRRTREQLEASLSEAPSPMWTYPVVREKCGCGAYTETVLFDDKSAADYFAEWRATHGCTIRVKTSAS